MRSFLIALISLVLSACQHPASLVITPELGVTTGEIEILHPDAHHIIDPSAKITIHADGFKWTEGPLWIEDAQGDYLLFSDIPNNVIMRYQKNVGTSIYLDKAGTSNLYPDDYIKGSNGLLLNHQKQLVVFQQGDRRISIMNASLASPVHNFTSLVSHQKGKRLNSPNDGVFHSNGDLYFTDPPYGLKKGITDTKKELPYQGIYKLTPSGKLTLLDDSLTYPNGITLSLDEKTLYVAVSDTEHPVWLAYDVMPDGTLTNKRTFYDASRYTKKYGIDKGYPDGLVVHPSGYILATGAEGVWIFNASGEVLAKIKTGRLTSNCTLSADGNTLFMTAHDTLMSVSLKHIIK